MRTTLVLVLALLCRLGHASPAGPTPDVTPPGMASAVALPPPPTDQGEASYWYQTIGADMLAFGLLVGAAKANSSKGESVAKLSIGVYLLGGPIIHVAHDRPGRALGSVALRAGLPLVGGLIGAAFEPKRHCDEFDPYEECDGDGIGGPALLGLMTGVVAAMIVDSTVLSDGRPPKAKPQPSWTPTAGATRNGFALGVSGRF